MISDWLYHTLLQQRWHDDNTLEPIEQNDSDELILCCGTSVRRTPLGPTKSSIIERVSSGQGFIIHYVGYIWDSVSVHYRGMRGVL